MRIERGVPISQRHKRQGFPFEDLLPGDSVLLPVKDAAETHDIRMAVGYLKRVGKGEYVTRKAEGGLRVWRIR